uniref:Insulinoma-associated protein 1b-like n=1 Tax=Petromyzon marinus TaxID=7757 RepID=A0AAJ7TMS7_PETMA|nr:insulinoma-associated protein 1b-like [Petromyzon marinus]
MPRGFLVKRRKERAVAPAHRWELCGFHHSEQGETPLAEAAAARASEVTALKAAAATTAALEITGTAARAVHAYRAHGDIPACTPFVSVVDLSPAVPLPRSNAAVGDDYDDDDDDGGGGQRNISASDLDSTSQISSLTLPPVPALTEISAKKFENKRMRPVNKCQGDSAPNNQTMKKPKLVEDALSSPVLGLVIATEPWCRVEPTGSVGSFVCQLCGLSYEDPSALARHGCSRIVRVLYTCPECDKSFSCSANLASHRRWHRPRLGNDEVEVKENRRRGGALECPRCGRTFSKRDSLLKHLAALHGDFQHQGQQRLQHHQGQRAQQQQQHQQQQVQRQDHHPGQRPQEQQHQGQRPPQQQQHQLQQKFASDAQTAPHIVQSCPKLLFGPEPNLAVREVLLKSCGGAGGLC